MQGESTVIWKKNMLEDLELGNLEYKTAEKFLAGLKKEFGEGDKKAAELKKVEQGERTIEKFIQEFKRAIRESGYKRRPLVKEFKKEISRIIRRKLIEVKRPPTSIK